MKKHLPLIFGILLVGAGLGAATKSLVGGILLILAGLIILPAVRKLVASSTPNISVLNNLYVGYGLALVLVISGANIINSAETNALIAEFQNNKDSVLKEISEKQAQKDYGNAKVIIEKYLKAIPKSEELIALKKLNDTKLEALEAEQKAKLAQENEKQKAKTKESASTNQSQSGVVSVESDPDSVGKCFGILARETEAVGIAGLNIENKNYIAKHAQARDIIIKMLKETSDCLKPGVLVESCLGAYNQYQSTLFKGFNSGVTEYTEASKLGRGKIAVYLLGCTE
jgi:hypothetical protein